MQKGKIDLGVRKRTVGQWIGACGLLAAAAWLGTACGADPGSVASDRRPDAGEPGDSPGRDAGQTERPDSSADDAGRPDADPCADCEPEPEPRCSVETCPGGCCDAAGDCVQLAVQSIDACGFGGEVCAVCDTAQVCDRGECIQDTWDPNASIRLRVGVITVAPCCGEGSAPDLRVCLTVGGSRHCSRYCDNSLSCDYGSGTNLFQIDGLTPTDLVAGMHVEVIDVDNVFDDMAYEGNVSLPNPVPKQPMYYLSPSGNLVSFEFFLEEQQ